MNAKKTASSEEYRLHSRQSMAVAAAPRLPYAPPRAEGYQPRIGLVGCGGVASTHLQAYRAAGYNVCALVDMIPERAEQMRRQWFPQARVMSSADELFANPSLEIVDLATHPAERVGLIQTAIAAGKHVLSQKPFVEDLATGDQLVQLAERHRVQLAVNQNGRWAPHVSYIRHAIEQGILGQLVSVDLAIHWDHNWCAGTQFDSIRHLILYDFGIHWFDMIHCYFPAQKPLRVVATTARTAGQTAVPALSAQATIEFPNAQASIVFRGNSRFGASDRTVVVGTEGTLVSSGPTLNEQSVALYSLQGIARPALTGCWFPDGFDGAMSELICAIAQGREPYNSARDNLESLKLCFAAVASAESGRAIEVGSVTKLDPNWRVV